MNLKKVTVLCGGQSAEHEVSIRSAKTVVAAINPKHYQVQVIYINQKGQWFWWEKEAFLAAEVDQLKSSPASQMLTLLLGHPGQCWMSLQTQEYFDSDIIFPLIHGTHGEDGDLQGLLEMMNKAYVGAGVLSSAACMDKVITKQLTFNAGVPTCRWVVLRAIDDRKQAIAQVEKHLGYPCFVKPSCLGSSVGISKAKNREALEKAIDFAFKYDNKLIIEEMIVGREIECSVLGNDNPRVAWPGELIVHHEFYSYEAKYIDPEGATVIDHSDLDSEVAAEIQDLALRVYKEMECSGMARIDFFLTQDNKPYFNEINTIPGFTSISMYPKAWEANGIPLEDLLSQIIECAVDRYEQRRLLSHQLRLESDQISV